MASDSGSPPLSASINVSITADENLPVFSKLWYTSRVREEHAVFSTVLTLQTSSSSSVVYQILEGNVDVSAWAVTILLLLGILVGLLRYYMGH